MNLTLNFRTRSVAELEARGFFHSHWLGGEEEKREKWLNRMERNMQTGNFKREEEIPFHLPCREAFDSIPTLKEHRENTPAHQQPSVYYVHSWAVPSEGHVVDRAQEAVGSFFKFSVDPANTYVHPYFDRWEPYSNYDDYKGVALAADLSLPFGRSSTGTKDWHLEVIQTNDSSILSVDWENPAGMKQGLDRFLGRMQSFIRLCRAGAKYDKALRLMEEHHQYQGAARSIIEGLQEMTFAFDICG